MLSPSDLLKIFGPAGGSAPGKVLRPQGQGEREGERERLILIVYKEMAANVIQIYWRFRMVR